MANTSRPQSLSLLPNKTSWTVQQDNMIKESLKMGIYKWSEIAKQVPGDRTGKQCRERWANHLNPKLKRTPWSKEEDKQLVLLQKDYGNSWSKISHILIGRSENDIKNRWNSRNRRKSKFRDKDMFKLNSVGADFNHHYHHQEEPLQQQQQQQGSLNPVMVSPPPSTLSSSTHHDMTGNTQQHVDHAAYSWGVSHLQEPPPSSSSSSSSSASLPEPETNGFVAMPEFSEDDLVALKMADLYLQSVRVTKQYLLACKQQQIVRPTPSHLRVGSGTHAVSSPQPCSQGSRNPYFTYSDTACDTNLTTTHTHTDHSVGFHSDVIYKNEYDTINAFNTSATTSDTFNSIIPFRHHDQVYTSTTELTTTSDSSASSRSGHDSSGSSFTPLLRNLLSSDNEDHNIHSSSNSSSQYTDYNSSSHSSSSNHHDSNYFESFSFIPIDELYPSPGPSASASASAPVHGSSLNSSIATFSGYNSPFTITDDIFKFRSNDLNIDLCGDALLSRGTSHASSGSSSNSNSSSGEGEESESESEDDDAFIVGGSVADSAAAGRVRFTLPAAPTSDDI